MKRLLWTLLAVCSCLTAQGQLSPLDFGLHEATSDSARYWVLYHTHRTAADSGVAVSYKGIDTIQIRIPADAKSLPLTDSNDFGHVVMVVKNNARSLFLFASTPKMEPLPYPDSNDLNNVIDEGHYFALDTLREGRWLLEVTDSTLWVDNREDHTYGHYRNELIRVSDGISTDLPAMPYSGTDARPHLRGRRVDSDLPFLFANITLIRDSGATCRTYLLDVENRQQVTLRGIVVSTPIQSKMVDDAIIKVYNCAEVELDSVALWGSYSRPNRSGYGLVMNNLRDTRVRRLTAVSPWGIFGTNNMYNTMMEDCDFNRFDIHCYGRDVTFRHCRQKNGYNQFSSVVGIIVFDHCLFDNFTPVLIEDSYNAYTHFVLRMDSCQWWLTRRNHTLMHAGRLGFNPNTRKELQTPCLPDIEITGLTTHTPKGVKELTLFYYSGKKPQTAPIGGIGHIDLRGWQDTGMRPAIKSANKKVQLLQEVRITMPVGTDGQTEERIVQTL